MGNRSSLSSSYQDCKKKIDNSKNFDRNSSPENADCFFFFCIFEPNSQATRQSKMKPGQ